MLKYAVMFGIVLVVAIFVSTEKQRHSYNSIPNAQQTVNKTTQESNRENSQRDKNNFEWYAPAWYSFFTWPDSIAAWAVFFTLFAIAEQTKATKDAVETNQQVLRLQENTAKRQLRAYMVLRNARLFLHENGAVEAKMEIANCGQTPAYNFRGGHLCRFTLYPVPESRNSTY